MSKGRRTCTEHSSCENRYRVLPCDEDRLQQLPARAFPQQGEEPHRRNAPHQDWLNKRRRRAHCFPARQTELQKRVPATVAHDEIAGRIIFLFPLFGCYNRAGG
ncbi:MULTISPECIES: hypothetical protein [Bacteroidales]|uniref:hypothetical protein n=1 Tax=Bacteroidales TaxID=171549 RepID=UPI00214B0D20|nr:MULTISPECIES: hypothetical protein [Bacteroidales]